MSTELTIRIKLDNDTFKPDPRHEVARLLSWTAANILQDGVPDQWDELTIRDINGNRVGRLKTNIDEDDDEQ